MAGLSTHRQPQEGRFRDFTTEIPSGWDYKRKLAQRGREKELLEGPAATKSSSHKPSTWPLKHFREHGFLSPTWPLKTICVLFVDIHNIYLSINFTCVNIV